MRHPNELKCCLHFTGSRSGRILSNNWEASLCLASRYNSTVPDESQH